MEDMGLLINLPEPDRTIGVLVTIPKDYELSGKEVLANAIREGATRVIETGVAIPNSPILSITMHDKVTEYQTYEDIPDVDVPCPCGNPNHWLIKYEMS